MPKLSKKDRDLITAHSLGNMLRSSSTSINKLSKSISSDEDVRDIVVGSLLVMGLNQLSEAVKRRRKALQEQDEDYTVPDIDQDLTRDTEIEDVDFEDV